MPLKYALLLASLMLKTKIKPTEKSQNKTSFKFELCHTPTFFSHNIIPYKYAPIREKIIKNILLVRDLKIETSDFLSLESNIAKTINATQNSSAISRLLNIACILVQTFISCFQ